MKKNRLVALLLLLCFCLSGCVRGERPAPAPTPVPVATSTPEPAPEPTPTPTPEPTPEPRSEDLVDLSLYIPSLYIDLKYATEDNFTGQVVYDFTVPQLRYGTVQKLARVQEALLEQGYSLKIWDAYRPVSAQFALWEICPDPNYVADPNASGSGHSRGNTVDLTLVTAEGEELPMPSGFDDFSALADRDYSDVPGEAAANARLLEEAMTVQGFRGYQKEWWHYTDSDDYPMVEE